MIKRFLAYLKYWSYSKFDTPRAFEKLEASGVLEDYKNFMNECEAFLFSEVEMYSISLPKPSKALEDFKNKFNKFF